MAEFKKFKMFGLNNIPDKASEILGSDFWDEINRVIPRSGPSVDVYRTPNEVIVVAEVTGVQSTDKINISVNGYRLIISGEIPFTYPVDEEDILQSERFIGSFSREIRLPPDVGSDSRIDARYRNGLIEIHIPRLQSQNERAVKIQCDE